MKQEELNGIYNNASQKTIRNIKDNYDRMEKGIVNQLYFETPHGGEIGKHREMIWGEMFSKIIPRKFAVEQSVFIIDSYGQVSREVDLVIFDETYTPYIFSYGELKFIPIEAVAVAIECKSKSINQAKLMTWVDSIKTLKTSTKSYARMYSQIACGESDTATAQTATRPLRILCCLNENVINQPLENKEAPFDIIIKAEDKKGRLQIQLDSGKKSLYDWYAALNHAEGIPEHKEGIRGKDTVTEIGMDKYLVHYKGETLSLLTFNLQLNQILIMINNPMMFPHLAYAEMFNNNGNLEVPNEGTNCCGVRR